MKINYTKRFLKDVEKFIKKDPSLRAKIKDVIIGIEKAQVIQDIPQCKKIQSSQSVYRIKIDSYRAFFVDINENNEIILEYFIHRSKAYNKESMNRIKNLSKE